MKLCGKEQHMISGPSNHEVSRLLSHTFNSNRRLAILSEKHMSRHRNPMITAFARKVVISLLTRKTILLPLFTLVQRV